MVGKIYLVRHGHGLHNIEKNFNSNSPRLRDADLTIKGEFQSLRLGPELISDSGNVGLILTSPLSRSIHTALLAFSDILDKRFYFENGMQDNGGVRNGIDLIIDPYLQEIGDEIYNTGSSIADLQWSWPHLNFSLLKTPWPEKSGIFSPAQTSVKIVASVRKDLLARITSLEGKDIVVVTHSGFIGALTEANLDFGNGDFKSFNVTEQAGGISLSLTR